MFFSGPELDILVGLVLVGGIVFTATVCQTLKDQNDVLRAIGESLVSVAPAARARLGRRVQPALPAPDRPASLRLKPSGTEHSLPYDGWKSSNRHTEGDQCYVPRRR